MGLLNTFFKVLHPIRAITRGLKRALIPRPIRRARWIAGGILDPVGRVKYSARRSAIRAVDKAITPKRRRKPKQPTRASTPSAPDLQRQQLLTARRANQRATDVLNAALVEINILEEAYKQTRLGEIPTKGAELLKRGKAMMANATAEVEEIRRVAGLSADGASLWNGQAWVPVR